MSTITLREYHSFIDDLLERNALSEAIVHCTHILSSFPKSIKTYQQLGQALLDLKRYADAAEVFSKVISVYPDDFVAHVGLSIVHEENRELDKAIWHMEQAFETQPSNAAIQDEFRRLISRRDGALPSKIRLTRGALIRMYAKGELYQQAIAECLSALQADPERIDLKLLLGRLYTLTNAETSAAEICNEILIGHPFCFEANQIMYELSSSVTNSGEYNPVYLQRLTELDPYYEYISTASENVADVPADKVMLEKSEYYAQDDEFSHSPEWADQIGIPWHDDSEDVVKSQAQLEPSEGTVDDEFLSELLTPTPFIEDETIVPESEFLPDFDEKEAPESVLPEWIAKAGWVRANEGEQPAGTESYDELPISEITDEIEQPAQPAESLPDWLHSIPTEGSDSPQLFASSEEEGIPEAAIPPLPPDMLAELLSEESEPFADLPISFEGSETEVVNLPGNVAESESLDLLSENSDGSVPDLPDWLKDLEVPEATLPEVEAQVSLPQETQEPASSSSPVEFEISDFLAEIETSDLVGDLDAVSEEEIGPEESLQSTPDDLVDFEFDLGLIGEEPSVSPSSEEEPVFPTFESIADELASSETGEPLELEQSFEGVEQKEPEPFETKPVETASPASIPAWVKNILSGPPDNAPIISATPSVNPESEPVLPSSMADSEEFIEELITDLPDEPLGAGAISEEVTAELETWLQEVDSEEAEISTAELENLESTASDVQVPEISLESLLESSEIEETEELVAELDNEQVVDDAAFDNRLSSMVGTDEDALEEISAVEIEEDKIAKADIERVVDLLQSGDYSTFTQEIAKLPTQDEVADQVIAELDAALQNHPDNVELWQDMGDLLSRKESFNEALDAYREAEKNILI